MKSYKVTLQILEKIPIGGLAVEITGTVNSDTVNLTAKARNGLDLTMTGSFGPEAPVASKVAEAMTNLIHDAVNAQHLGSTAAQTAIAQAEETQRLIKTKVSEDAEEPAAPAKGDSLQARAAEAATKLASKAIVK